MLSEVTETEPKLHGGRQPSAPLALPPCLAPLWCFSLGLSHLEGHSSCLLVVGGQGRLGWAPPWSYFFLEIEDGASRGAGPSSDAGEKFNQLSWGSAMLGMGR